jgi:hypothetical protein
VKVTIGGEVFDFDAARRPLSEALAIEKALGIPYAAYDEGLRAGSARSVAAFIWLVWRRNGKDVPLADILSGAVDVDLDTLEVDTGGDEDAGEAGPTTPTPPVLSTTAAGTSARSRKSSASARGSSAS